MLRRYCVVNLLNLLRSANVFSLIRLINPKLILCTVHQTASYTIASMTAFSSMNQRTSHSAKHHALFSTMMMIWWTIIHFMKPLFVICSLASCESKTRCLGRNARPSLLFCYAHGTNNMIRYHLILRALWICTGFRDIRMFTSNYLVALCKQQYTYMISSISVAMFAITEYLVFCYQHNWI